MELREKALKKKEDAKQAENSSTEDDSAEEGLRLGGKDLGA